MKSLIYSAIFLFTLQVYAISPSNIAAKDIYLTQKCGEISSQLMKYRHHVNPIPPREHFQKQYLKKHQEFKAELARVKLSQTIKDISNILNYRENQIDVLINICMNKKVSSDESQVAFAVLPGSEGLDIKRLEQQNIYILTLVSKKRELSLDPMDHLENAAEAQTFSIHVGEKSFNEVKVGSVMASNFNEWGFLIKGEWARIVVKVSKKHHKKTYFAELTNGLTARLSEVQFPKILQAFKNDGGKTVVRQNILGHDRYEILPINLTKLDILSSQPMTRYYAKVKLRSASFTFDLDQHLENFSGANTIEIEIPKSLYDSRSKIFEPSLNLGTLLIKDRFDVFKGTIVSKYTQADQNWLEVRLKDGNTLFLERAFVASLP